MKRPRRLHGTSHTASVPRFWRERAIAFTCASVFLSIATQVADGPATASATELDNVVDVAADLPSLGAPAPHTVEQLLAGFRALPGLEARFVEEKHLGLLAEPLVSEGVLYFLPPGYLRRDLVAPMPSVVVITPDELRFSDATSSEIIDLRERSDVRLFVGALSQILIGDQAALAGIYDMTYQVGVHEACAIAEQGWTLTLRPRSSPLSDIIGAVVVLGTGQAVNEIRVYETAGDTTITRILSADPGRVFRDDERQGLFGIATP